jgi:hypothetical protein
MKPRRPLPRSTRPIAKQSKKQEARYGKQYSTITKRGGKPKAKKRSAKETTRIYGPLGRAAFTKEQPCVGCGRLHASDNHHTQNGGTGRKASYTTIVPLCRKCHHDVHNHGAAAFERVRGISFEQEAAKHEQRWLASLGVDD